MIKSKLALALLFSLAASAWANTFPCPTSLTCNDYNDLTKCIIHNNIGGWVVDPYNSWPNPNFTELKFMGATGVTKASANKQTARCTYASDPTSFAFVNLIRPQPAYAVSGPQTHWNFFSDDNSELVCNWPFGNPGYCPFSAVTP